MRLLLLPGRGVSSNTTLGGAVAAESLAGGALADADAATATGSGASALAGDAGGTADEDATSVGVPWTPSMMVSPRDSAGTPIGGPDKLDSAGTPITSDSARAVKPSVPGDSERAGVRAAAGLTAPGVPAVLPGERAGDNDGERDTSAVVRGTTRCGIGLGFGATNGAKHGSASSSAAEGRSASARANILPDTVRWSSSE